MVRNGYYGGMAIDTGFDAFGEYCTFKVYAMHGMWYMVGVFGEFGHVV